MSDEEQTRDRVRALVREVLDKALPAEAEAEASTSSSGTSTASPSSGTTRETPAAPPTRSRFIDTVPQASMAGAGGPPPARDESSKMVITEDDVRGLEQGARLRIAEGARLTPLAADMVRERGIELVRRVPRRGPRESKLVAVGADHGGYKMKEELKLFLAELGHRVRDYGTDSEEAVDYPDIAHAVAQSVANLQAEVGIIIDGAGVGSAMTANKVPGVRAAACYSVAVAVNSREHNDANVLSLGSKTINSTEMREIVGAWLATEITEERHRKRVGKITNVERQYSR